MKFGVIKEVCQVEGDDTKVVGGMHTRIDVPYEPLVVMHDPLLYRRMRRHARIIAAEEGSWCLDLVALVKLALQIGDSDHDSEVLPDVLLAQLKRVANDARDCSGSSWNLSLQSLLSLQPVEMLGEAATVRAKVVALDDEHGKRVQLIEGVQGTEKVSRVSLRSDG